jgi:hypothetical protein
MTDFLVKRLPYDLSSHAGLAFIGKYLQRININALIDPAFPVRSGIANSDIVKSYLGLLCLGKNDFDAIESFRGNAFFMRALPLAASLVTGPLSVSCRFGLLLCQADAGNLRPGRGLWARDGSSIIKWNPRKTRVETVAAVKLADASNPAWRVYSPDRAHDRQARQCFVAARVCAGGLDDNAAGAL